MEATDSFNVVVVGGGMVGTSAALSLAQNGFSVAIVEVVPAKAAEPGAERANRVSAISRTSQQFLSSLNVWDEIQKQACAYEKMVVWDAQGSGKIQFSAEELGQPDLGHIVENQVIQNALWAQFVQYENLTSYCPDKVVSISIGEVQTLALESGLQLQADVVLAADGAFSKLRDMVNIGTRAWFYDQNAIVATIATEQSHQYTAWQRFMPSGPLAFLPLPEPNKVSIVWSCEPDLAGQLMAMNDDEFCHQLTSASENILGKISGTGDRGMYPLRAMHANQYVKQGIVLIGDAAHTIHPLAGQGVNLGFKDAKAIVKELTDAARQKRPLSDMAVLRRYERSRKADNVAMQMAMDGFKRLFSNRNPLLVFVRNAGLTLSDKAGGVKRQLVKQAMGL